MQDLHNKEFEKSQFSSNLSVEIELNFLKINNEQMSKMLNSYSQLKLQGNTSFRN